MSLSNPASDDFIQSIAKGDTERDVDTILDLPSEHMTPEKLIEPAFDKNMKAPSKNVQFLSYGDVKFSSPKDVKLSSLGDVKFSSAKKLRLPPRKSTKFSSPKNMEFPLPKIVELSFPKNMEFSSPNNVKLSSHENKKFSSYKNGKISLYNNEQRAQGKYLSDRKEKTSSDKNAKFPGRKVKPSKNSKFGLKSVQRTAHEYKFDRKPVIELRPQNSVFQSSITNNGITIEFEFGFDDTISNNKKEYEKTQVERPKAHKEGILARIAIVLHKFLKLLQNPIENSPEPKNEEDSSLNFRKRMKRSAKYIDTGKKMIFLL